MRRIGSKWRLAKPFSRMTREEMQTFDVEHAGDFVAVPLGDEFAFGRFLPARGFAFYDLKLPQVPPLDEIERSPVLFIVHVELHAVTSGRWRVVGNRRLPELLSAPVKYFRHPMGSDFLDIYVGGKFQPYAGEDLTKMEMLAVWGPRHVERRLLCHFAGVRDDHTEEMRIPRGRADRFRREYFAQLEAARGKK